jgi:methyl-accepting chemotaxis protein
MNGTILNFLRSLKGKFLAYFLVIAIVPLALAVGLLTMQTNNALEKDAFNLLGAAQEIKKGQIKNYFNERQGDLGVLVETVSTLKNETTEKLVAVRDIKSNQIETYFKRLKNQILILREDPFIQTAITELTLALDEQETTNLWDETVLSYESRLLTIKETNGWYDFFLLNEEGKIIYSVERESDLFQLVTDAELIDSGLGLAYQKLQEANAPLVTVGEFKPYQPSGGIPAGFLMTTVNLPDGQTGYIAIQIPLDQINQIMQERNGLGETGETYLVGPDKLMRSDSYLDPIYHSVEASFADPKNGAVNTTMVQLAFKQNAGVAVDHDYNGNPVISAYKLVNISEDIQWAILAEMDVAEAFSPVDSSGVPFFQKYQEMYGYYDLFLINPDGYIFFTVVKEPDYQTNLVTGPYRDTGLGKVFRQVSNEKTFGFADFEPYAPSAGVPAAFIAQPVINELSGNVDVVVALQLPLEDINAIMQERTGMGETGETYLVGPGQRMRSDSYLDPVGHSVTASFAGSVEENGVDTLASQEALQGLSGEKIITDYNGNSVLSVYDPIDLFGTRWAVIAEIDEAEAFATVNRMQLISIILLLVLMVFVALIAWFIAGNITQPIMTITQGSQRLAIGDASLQGLDQKKLNQILKRKDELGAIGHAFQSLMVYFSEMAEHAQAITHGNLTVTVVPKDQLDLLGNSFQQMIQNLREMIEQITNSADNMSVASEQLAGAAKQSGEATNQIASTMQQVARGTAQQSESVNHTANSVDQMNRAIEGVAKGAQEQSNAASKAAEITAQISQAIQQVAQNAQNVTIQATKATNYANDGSKTMEETIMGMQSIREKVGLSAQKVQEMGERSQQIGMIVETIEDIASQTNLLALNAAIEAARAGEHGKGFAVVADEVRKLAERSASATKEIANLVSGIRFTVSEAVTAMGDGSKEVDEGVKRVNLAGDALTSILMASQAVNQQAEEAAAAAQQMTASANDLVAAVDSVSAVIEENTASTEEMAANSTEVRESIESIASVSEENSAAVEEVSASAEEMSAQVEEVNASAASLAEMAQWLKEIINQFKIKESSQADLLEEIETFKRAHINWVERVQKMQNGGPAIQSKDVPTHKNCSVGRWYYGIGASELGHKQEFKDIEEPHIQFHKILQDYVTSFAVNDPKKSAQLLEKLKTHSQQIAKKLDSLKASL